MVYEQQCYYADQCGFLNQCLPAPIIGVESFCVHDPALPLTIYNSIVYAITPILLGIGMLGGLGGGILKGPVLELLLGYNQIQATVIGYCFMFGGCIINAIFLVFDKNPIDPQRPMIDYDLAVIFNCSLSLGTSFGGIVNMFVPQFYVFLLQQMFLLTACPYLYKKGMKAWQENKKEGTKVEQILIEEINSQRTNINFQREDMQHDQELYKKIRDEDTVTFPITKWTIILTFFLTTQLFMTLLPIQLEEVLNLPFKLKYLTMACLMVINVPMSYMVYKYGSKNDKNKIAVSYTQTGLYFQPYKFLFIYASGFMSGLVSGMLGLGSGLILVPVMIYLKLHPRVSSSTSAFCYFWMGLTNILNLIINQLMELDDALLFMGLALFGGSVVTRIGNSFVLKYNCSYMLIFIVFGLGVSNIFVGTWYVVKESQSFGFHSLLESNN